MGLDQKHGFHEIDEPYRVHQILQENMRTGIRHYQPRLTNADRFCAVFQTDWQRKTMKRWLAEIPIILMDTTHNVGNHTENFTKVFKPNETRLTSGTHFGCAMAYCIIEERKMLVQSITRVRSFTIRCKGKNEKGVPLHWSSKEIRSWSIFLRFVMNPGQRYLFGAILLNFLANATGRSICN